MGQGDGTGKGTGEGSGGDPTTGVLAGSVVACCFLFFMFFFGIPLFIAGIVLVSQANNSADGLGHDVDNSLRTAGIVCIVIAVILMIIGIILIVLTCCLGSRSGRGQPGQVVQPTGQTTTIITTSVAPGSQPGQPAVPPGQWYHPSAGGQYPAGQYPGGQYPPSGGQYPAGGQYPTAGAQYPAPYYDPNAPATQHPPPYTPSPSAPTKGY